MVIPPHVPSSDSPVSPLFRRSSRASSTSDPKSHPGLNLDFYNSGRNMSVDSPEQGLHIHYRFMGHYSLSANHFGLETFFVPQTKHELACYFGDPGNRCGTPPPDIIIAQAGLHDKPNKKDPFPDLLPPLLERLLDVRFWRSDFLSLPSFRHTFQKDLLYNV